MSSSVCTNSSRISTAEEDWSLTSFSTTEWNAKYECILDCLRQEPQINLWQLRQLALSPGGLLCPQLRKRAWAVLLSCPELFLVKPGNSTSTSGSSSSTPDPVNLDLMHDEVSSMTNIWNIQDQLIRSKQRQREETAMLHAAASTVCSMDTTAPTRTSTTTATHENEHVWSTRLQEKLATLPEHESVTTEGSEDDYNHHEDDDTVTLSHSLPPPTQHHTITPQEQTVLRNVLYSALCGIDDYVPGLPHLAALVMINVESPSITALALQRLLEVLSVSSFAWNATSPQQQQQQGNMRSGTIFHECVTALQHALEMSSETHPHHTAITTRRLKPTWWWFLQDLRMASRLLDVIVVSHPIMTVYLAVAWQQQQQDHDDDDDKDHSAKDVEAVIAQALEYLKQISPDALLSLACNNASAPPEMPAWCTKSFASQNWRAAAAPQQGDDDDCKESCSPDHDEVFDYPLARIALGQPVPLGLSTKRQQKEPNRSPAVVAGIIVTLGGIVALLMAGVVVSSGSHNYNISSSSSSSRTATLPTTPRVLDVPSPASLPATRKATAVPETLPVVLSPPTKTTTWRDWQQHVRDFLDDEELQQRMIDTTWQHARDWFQDQLLWNERTQEMLKECLDQEWMDDCLYL